MSKDKAANQNGSEKRSELLLSTLAPARGSRSNRRRIGRGEASGVGKTCGKGHKGQKSRAGASIPAWFEGGQMPLYRRIKNIGFQSRKRIQGLNQYRIVDVTVLNGFDNGTVVGAEQLKEIGYGPKSGKRAGIKIVGNGELSKKLTVQVNAVTSGARERIEGAGGTVEVSGPATVKTQGVKGEQG